jgi:glycosyltransferase involved in cell wall biosynthesis
MLSAAAATLRLRAGSACLVAADPGGLTGAGAWLNPLVALLRDQGGRVRVLCCGEPSSHAVDGLERSGIEWLSLDRLVEASLYGLPNLYGAGPADASDLVREALERLHRQAPLDLIVFPVLKGLGFRTLQARRAGLAFQDVTVAVYLDSCSARVRQEQQRWPDGVADLELDYIERYVWEQADERWAPDCTFENRTPAQPGVESGTPRVSLCVPHFNLGPFLPETLASIAAQTWPHLEVLVIDDGSTDADSIRVFDTLQDRYPGFRFVRQANAGIGQTRNRGLWEARGDYFIPVDADNVLCPDLVERLLAGIRSRPELGALTCYFLAFETSEDLERQRYRYACRPVGGPGFLASLRNVYGDALAIYRTAAFRAVGGYEVDRDTSFEDWEAFVKLARAGYAIDVLPRYLFYYRHRESGFSRTTRYHANRERVLRQFRHGTGYPLPAGEAAALWDALAGFHQKAEELAARQRCLRYQVADHLYRLGQRLPLVLRVARCLLRWRRGLPDGKKTP